PTRSSYCPRRPYVDAEAIWADTCSGSWTGAVPGWPVRIVLAGTPAPTLARNDRTAHEDLTAPDTPWLLPGQGAFQALALDRGGLAQCLGLFDLGGAVGTPEAGRRQVLAGQGGVGVSRQRADERPTGGRS